MNDVIMYSGGVDSFLVHQWLRSNKIDHELIYFNLGGKYSNNEINLFNTDAFLKYVGQNVSISDCLHMGSLEEEDAHIPNRNLLTAIMAQSVTGYQNIWIGGTMSDRTLDNTFDCFHRLSSLLSIVNKKKIKVTSPFWANHKAELVKQYVNSKGWNLCESNNDARDSLITSTFSCYYPNEEKKVKIVYRDSEDTIYTGHETREIITTECLNCKACFRKCMSLFAGGIMIPMLKTEESIKLVTDYYNESMEGLQNPDDPMSIRYQWTIRYCDYLKQLWGLSNGCKC